MPVSLSISYELTYVTCAEQFFLPATARSAKRVYTSYRNYVRRSVRLFVSVCHDPVPIQAQVR